MVSKWVLGWWFRWLGPSYTCIILLHCVPKKHDHVFDDNLNYFCPFTKIFVNGQFYFNLSSKMWSHFLEHSVVIYTVKPLWIACRCTFHTSYVKTMFEWRWCRLRAHPLFLHVTVWWFSILKTVMGVTANLWNAWKKLRSCCKHSTALHLLASEYMEENRLCSIYTRTDKIKAWMQTITDIVQRVSRLHP